MKRRDVTRPLHPPVQITDREIEATYIYIYISISRRIEVAPHRVHSDLKRREV